MNAIPEDLIYIDPIANQSQTNLILEDDSYNLIAQTSNGKTVLFELTIKKD